MISVKGYLAPGVKSSREVLADLQDNVFPSLEGKYSGLEISLGGEQRDQAETGASLGPNYLLALFAIFTLLAIPFKSYIQPIIVMSAIPFGFVGAVAGHVLMGYSLSMLSMFGIVALTGVVVNDSLVLIDATNQYRLKGVDAREAILMGAKRRLRPILLTSLTTFLGLAPMILEESVQARFLIPMAISLGFGVLFATFVILLLVPALYLITEDLIAFKERIFSKNEWQGDVVELEDVEV
jgi:multidrug efflux pump subunit AcrB